MIPAPPPPQPGQTLLEYGTVLVQYVQVHGTCRLSGDQLRWADAAAQHYASTVQYSGYLEAEGTDARACRPGELEEHQYKILEAFSAARHAIAAAQRARARQLADLQAALDAVGLGPSPEELGAQLDHAPQDRPSPFEQLSPAEQAVRLLQAALRLIIGPRNDDQPGGGRPARLQPAPLRKPPGGSSVDPSQPSQSNLPPKDGINF